MKGSLGFDIEVHLVEWILQLDGWETVFDGSGTQCAADLVLMILFEKIVCFIITNVVALDQISVQCRVSPYVARETLCSAFGLWRVLVDQEVWIIQVESDRLSKLRNRTFRVLVGQLRKTY